MEVGADLVGLAGAESVALCATGLEETSTLASVTCTRKQSKAKPNHRKSAHAHFARQTGWNKETYQESKALLRTKRS